MSEGSVAIERINGHVRVTQADRKCRISLELLDSVRAGDTEPWMTTDGEWLYISDDYAQQFCYRLGDLDDLGQSRWMEML